MEKLFTDLLKIGTAIGIVYLFSWAAGVDPDSIVGWVALGMAATR